ncbi:hypothetical protein [Sphingobium sp.]
MATDKWKVAKRMQREKIGTPIYYRHQQDSLRLNPSRIARLLQ